MSKNKFVSFLKEYRDIIITSAIIIVPCILFVVVLISASLKSNTVIVGNRYRNDLNPAISKDNIKELDDTISLMSSVDEVEINLKTSQLRVLADVKDSITKEEAEQLCKDIYEKINNVLDVHLYFEKNVQGEKMYDLEITVVNDPNKTSDFIMYTLVKNSTMDSYEISLVSEPKDPELVEELLLKEEERKNPSNTSPETTPQYTEELEDGEAESEATE